MPDIFPIPRPLSVPIPRPLFVPNPRPLFVPNPRPLFVPNEIPIHVPPSADPFSLLKTITVKVVVTQSGSLEIIQQITLSSLKFSEHVPSILLTVLDLFLQ